jgi:hypothetical protein
VTGEAVNAPSRDEMRSVKTWTERHPDDVLANGRRTTPAPREQHSSGNLGCWGRDRLEDQVIVWIDAHGHPPDEFHSGPIELNPQFNLAKRCGNSAHSWPDCRGIGSASAFAFRCRTELLRDSRVCQ